MKDPGKIKSKIKLNKWVRMNPMKVRVEDRFLGKDKKMPRVERDTGHDTLKEPKRLYRNYLEISDFSPINTIGTYLLGSFF